MQVQNLIKRKYFGVILISVLIGLITLVSVGIKYIGMNKEKAGIEAIEEENRKVEEEAENKKEVEKPSYNNTIFNVDWETFKNQWYNSLNSTNGNLSVITDMEENRVYLVLDIMDELVMLCLLVLIPIRVQQK